MKNSNWLAALVLTGLLFGLAGCSKEASVDTSALEKAFQGSEATVQTNVAKVVAAVRAESYASAMSALETIASQSRLTSEQEEAIREMVDRLRKLMTAQLEELSRESTKAMEKRQRKSSSKP